MPELPEVQTTVNGLQKKVLGGTFIDVWTDWEKMVKRPARFKEFKKQLKGRSILRVWRRAKNVVFELLGGYSLLIHMKMTGHLLVGIWNLESGIWKSVEDGPLKEKINGYLHIIFFLDNGKMIALSDMRKFAKVELVKTEDLHKEFEGLGPEPLEKSFTFEKFQALFTRRRGKVKQVIMVPQFIAGIGNIYASEALWEAKIHPVKDISKLGRKELRVLYNAIRKVLALGVEFGGDSFSDYRDVDGNKGKFEGKKKVYQRTGQPCLRCITLIKRLKIGQRSSFYCPACQTLNPKF
ncbi:MAG: DNA-formamidopyrimidine glycosylase [Candidatus Staskawiczbacteria bacterium RIFCSPHIGHO2_02_FULL_43_16]|uniref:DNA-formamidopyrimidine glycosylase n=1 Tax=Candidatus Staskawiczbacteria bacterium RIFCSPHIGHO2_01_FULL_41_41 TaxID=1802203 RepID=A0A1G2HSE6_9BACT|nr:MAG: DNA-formamidopyrimidine glycosylase [Candidatus Staskawiczbacteria bacterium RIFCSPHIGHO2_01_FULL_41_41]OGZ68117.1 MAG: DNA-formamidopyrimidine glycosylase [Candidatus Staskawiczbacteria bacterium RIFCSPHIGHO2_02_FULL_43_16]OGZ74856.1 MAG: DNA-formamidopyrimidine glycosylase [Candidatus Staskawiczbacteria bacterium RIFCSPLOWO2_01_FULL_43_17b]